jgi:transposase InsO family protein
MRRFEAIDGMSVTWQAILPEVLRREFLCVAYGGMTGGHLGREKTLAVVKSRAYWPSWSSDVDAFLRQCEPYAQYHRGVPSRTCEMQITLVGEPFEKVSIDITGPHPKSSRGNKFILTMVDHFSKWAEAMPLSCHTASVVARALMSHVFTRYGVPHQFLSDQGPEFESDLFTQLMKWMEIDKLRTTPYKPSTNGVVERFHRTLNSMLGKVVSESQRDWDERLPLVMAAYRASPHTSTGFSPNSLFLGRENRMPLDLIMGLPRREDEQERSADQFIIEMKEKAEAAYSLARSHLQVSAERRKATHDIRVKKEKFTVGEWVWYYYPRRYQHRSPKWQKHYAGPS